MGDLADTVYNVLAAYTGLSDARNHDIATRVADAVSTHTEAREAAAAEAMREACARYCAGRERIYAARAGASSDVTDAVVAASMAACFESAEDATRALPLPAADALSRALAQARAEEREACAKIADDEAEDCRKEGMGEGRAAAATTRDAIRARAKEVGGE